MNDILNPDNQFYSQGYNPESHEIFKGGNPRKIKFDDLMEFIEEIMVRRKLNKHEIIWDDDPKSLTIGALDKTANQRHYISLRDTKTQISNWKREGPTIMQSLIIKIIECRWQQRDYLMESGNTATKGM